MDEEFAKSLELVGRPDCLFFDSWLLSLSFNWALAVIGHKVVPRRVWANLTFDGKTTVAHSQREQRRAHELRRRDHGRELDPRRVWILFSGADEFEPKSTALLDPQTWQQTHRPIAICFLKTTIETTKSPFTKDRFFHEAARATNMRCKIWRAFVGYLYFIRWRRDRLRPTVV